MRTYVYVCVCACVRVCACVGPMHVVRLPESVYKCYELACQRETVLTCVRVDNLLQVDVDIAGSQDSGKKNHYISCSKMPTVIINMVFKHLSTMVNVMQPTRPKHIV